MKEMIEPELLRALEQSPQAGKWKVYEEYKDSGVEWLGEIPVRWEVRRLKSTILECQNGIWGDEPTHDEKDIVCVRVADFNRQNHRIKSQNLTIRSIPLTQRQGRMLRQGDLLIEKSGGGELQPVGIVMFFDLETPAVCSNFIARVQISKNSNAYFLCYLHTAIYEARLNTLFIKQNTGIQNLDADAYFNQKVALPSQSEQLAIATFLDRKTNKLNELIIHKEHMISLLQERRTAIINQAVTRGLNQDVPLKNSDVDWLGEIPVDWEVRRIRYISSFVTSGSRGWAQYYSDDGALFLRIGNLTRSSIALDLEDIQYVTPPEGAEGQRTKVHRNDLLISITAYIGSIAAVTENIGEAYVNQHIALVRLRLDIVNVKWLGYCLLSKVGQDQFQLAQRGGTKDGLSLDDVKNLSVLVPNILEQEKIVSYLDQETAKIDKLITVIQEGIKKLKEYSTALVSAAVTGKIDVRGEVANVHIGETAM